MKSHEEIRQLVAFAISGHAWALPNSGDHGDCGDWEDMTEEAQGIYLDAADAAIAAMSAPAEVPKSNFGDCVSCGIELGGIAGEGGDGGYCTECRCFVAPHDADEGVSCTPVEPVEVERQNALVTRLRASGETVHDRIWLHGIGSHGGEVTWANEPDPSGEPEEAEWAVEYVLAAHPTAEPITELQRMGEEVEHRLRMIVSHATGGNLQYDPAMSINDICVEISRMRNEVFAHGKEVGARDANRPSEQAPESWRHKKRGTVYQVIGEAELQCATRDPSEGDELVIYRGDDGKLWARMRDEFHDGRFEFISTRAAALSELIASTADEIDLPPPSR